MRDPSQHPFKSFLLLLLLTTLLVVGGCAEEGSKVLQFGDQAPQFTATAVDNRSVSLAAYAGSPVILRFFDPDCKYCKADTRAFNAIYEKYKEQGLKVVYLDVEPDPQELESFISDLKIVFPVILDSERSIAKLYRVKTVPQTIVLDPEHRIVHAILGGVGEADLQELIGKYFQGAEAHE